MSDAILEREDFEGRVLGCVLNYPQTAPTMVKFGVNERDFTLQAHKDIHAAAVFLYETDPEGDEPFVFRVTKYLRDEGKLHKLGGSVVLEQLVDPDTGGPVVEADMPRYCEALLALRNGTGADRAPWRNVTDDQVRDVIAGTALVPLVEALEAVAVPPLPLAATLPRALVLAGCAMSEPVTDYDPEDEGDQRRGLELCRLQIATAGGQALNAWHLLVAESGSGKDVGGVLDRLAGAMGWSIGTSGSAEGMADAYREIGNGLLSVSEFSSYLDARHWQAKATGWLTAAWNKGWFKVNLSKRTGGSRQARYCFPNVAANVQPEVLAQFATIQNLADGFLPRFLITRMDRLNWRPTTAPIDDHLDRAKRALCQYRNKAGTVQVPDGYLQAVQDMFHKHDAPFPGHWRRLVNEYGPRFAVMLSVLSGDKITGTVAVTDRQWEGAAVLIQWFYAHAELALATLAEDEKAAKYEAMLARLYRYIDRHGPAMLSDISRGCSRGTDSHARGKALTEMQSRGLIRETANGFDVTETPPPREWGVEPA